MFLLGHWRNYEEMEESLSLPELQATLEAKREQDFKQQKFAAALKGVNLDKHVNKDDDEDGPLTGDAIRRRVEAKMNNRSAEEQEFQEIGIKVISED